MSRLLIVKNIERESYGLLEAVADQRQIVCDIVEIEGGGEIPDVKNYQAIIVFGGPASANDADPKMVNEVAQVRTALSTQIPYLGICLGLQVMVRAAGGVVKPAATKEIGFWEAEGKPYTVKKTEIGKQDPLLAGLPDEWPTFQLHGETVDLTPSMQVIGSGTTTPNQIIRFGQNAYGAQGHFELTPDILTTLSEEDPDLESLSRSKLLEDFAAIRGQYDKIGTTIFNNFLTLAGFP